MKNKAAINMQIIFMILMGVFFVGILIFGYSNLTYNKEILDKAEVQKIQAEIKSLLEYCSDPLKSGSNRIKEIRNNKIGGICLLSDDLSNGGEFSGLSNTNSIKTIHETGDNVVILGKGSSENDASDILDSFEVTFYNSIDETQCWFAEGSDVVEIDITC